MKLKQRLNGIRKYIKQVTSFLSVGLRVYVMYKYIYMHRSLCILYAVF